MATSTDATFPCALTIDVPFPDARLSSVALQALRVDKELSSLIQRQLSTTAVPSSASSDETVLHIEYKATTNRMLRVAVNSFMESLALVLEVMGELDVDVLESSPEKDKAEAETRS
ncbi:transcription factor Pcc1-domain-containing protein [Podospora didyma]|uniref:Transcription factor Pcc1-domain-containing protein n=1 Tax=Podospora didyma TaxID=330526 RepID=A0AAE0U828_9PEZI|nr:transcription factor Pcc1-domain-containing protein [Podospora didyma]